MIKYLSLAYTFLVVFCIEVIAQPPLYNKEFHPHSKFIDKVFHPQTKENIAVMLESEYKTQLGITTEDSSYFDTVTIKKYNETGRLISYLNNDEHYLINYIYDKKGRVTEYYEAEKYYRSERPIYHFTITYTIEGETASITSKLDTVNYIGLTFNPETKVLRLNLLKRENEPNYYEYTLNNRQQLVSVNSKYYNSSPYSTKVYYNSKNLPKKEKGRVEIEIENTTFTTIYSYEKEVLTKETVTIFPGYKDTKETRGFTIEYNYNRGKLIGKIVSANNYGHIFKASYSYIYDEKNRLAKTTYKELKGYRGLAAYEEFYTYK